MLSNPTLKTHYPIMAPMPFETLHPAIRKALVARGIELPTKAQELAIPEIIRGRNLLLIAPTGIGKTESAIFPIFHNFLLHREVVGNYEKRGISILYVTPLRALNRDMLRRLSDWGAALDIDVAVRHGDTTKKERARQSKNPPDMLITTPETLQVLFAGSRLRQHISHVRWTVIDEVHELAQDERGAQLSVALERLSLLCHGNIFNGHDFQRIGLSATVGTPPKVARYLVGERREVKIINIASMKEFDIRVVSPEATGTDEDLSAELEWDANAVAALRWCREAIESHKSTLFFVNTRDHAEAITARYGLWAPDFEVGVHHGSLARDVRIQMEDRFKSGELRSLICTSSLELGIDVGNTDLVLQNNSPRKVERLIQRVGRAGHRVGEISRGIVVAANPDDIAEAMVITRRALAGELEQVLIRMGPLDVLANQINAWPFVGGENSIDDTFGAITRAYPFRRLDRDVFDRVLDLLASIRTVWVDRTKERIEEEGKEIGSGNEGKHRVKGFFGKGGAAIKYFYSNLSMIPDERKYVLRDMVENRQVAQLDEAYVLSLQSDLDKDIRPKFIVRGRSWRLVAIDHEKQEVTVEPVADLGALPNWLGEDIPVPYEIAQEVGRIRGRIAVAVVKMGKTAARKKMLSVLSKSYNAEKSVIRKVFDQIAGQLDEGYIVPDHRTILIETSPRVCIVNTCFGSKVNGTLGQLISYELAALYGAPVGVNTDPYRIMLETTRRVKPAHIEELLLDVYPDSRSFRRRMARTLEGSSQMKWQMLHTAKKFGAISPDADYRNLHMGRFMESYQGTPLMDEVVNKVFWDRMHIADTRRVIEGIHNGKIKIEASGLTPIGLAGIEHRKGLMVPKRATAAILKAMKKRIGQSRVRLFCVNCGITRRTKVEDLPELPERMQCLGCDGTVLACMMPWDDKLIDAVKKFIRGKRKRLKPDERKAFERLKKNANLMSEYGKRAAYALNARGVAEGNAARVLAGIHEDENEFFKALLEAEVNYARTKRFWD